MVLAFPPALFAQTQSAGSINREIPNVSIQHGTRSQLAAAGTKILWGDTVTTDRGGRARIVLDDGSILNVGSDSSLHVVQHDAAKQQTQLNLAYGRLRASAVRLARPGAGFEVRTPTAVAGVVGTGFDMLVANDMTTVSVNEGLVNFCNKTGACVKVPAGSTSTIRGNNAPSAPTQTSPSIATENAQNTAVGGGGGAGGAAGVTAAAGVSHSVLVVATVITVAVGGALGATLAAGSQPKRCGCTTVP